MNISRKVSRFIGLIINKLNFTVFFSFILFINISYSQPGPKLIRILTCGIRHESNTFTPYQTKEADFKVYRGGEALKDKPWAKYLQENGVEIIPILHAYTWPSGAVEKVAFIRFMKEILGGIKKAGNIDGIYIDMHGALTVTGFEDAQLTFINEIREIVGKDILISGSFDLHGNLSPEFVNMLNILTAYRTAPHEDAEETRKRAVQLLLNAIMNNEHPVIAQVIIPIIVPGEKAITAVQPLKTFYEELPQISKQQGLLDASIFIGYAWADVYRSSMSVHVVAKDTSYLSDAKKEAKHLAKEIWDARSQMKFNVPALKIDEAIQMAINRTEKTVFISDSGDNTTAGAAGDNPLVTERLLALDVKDAVIAGIIDSAAVKQCIKTGEGNQIKLLIGGKIDYVNGKPLEIEGKIIKLAVTKEKEKLAVINVKGILIVLQSKHRSFTTPAEFKEAGIDPLQHKIIVVKLGYLYPELRDIAPFAILALTPGFANLDITTLPYKNIAHPIYPLNPDMKWIPIIAR